MTRVLAHRGARRRAPENTVAALVQALESGADGVECDVRRTADDVLVLSHGPDAAGLGVVVQQTFAELRRGRRDLATLDEALEACRGRLVDVEVKDLPWEPGGSPAGRTASLVVELLEARRGRDEVIVSSFDLGSVDRVRALAGWIPTALLCLATFPVLEALAIAAGRGHHALHPPVSSLAGQSLARVLEAAEGHGLGIHPWTVNDHDELMRLAASGVGIVITDEVELAVQVTRARRDPVQGNGDRGTTTSSASGS